MRIGARSIVAIYRPTEVSARSLAPLQTMLNAIYRVSLYICLGLGSSLSRLLRLRTMHVGAHWLLGPVVFLIFLVKFNSRHKIGKHDRLV